MATSAGIEVVVCDGTEDGTLRAAAASGWGPGSRAPRSGAELQALAPLREAEQGRSDDRRQGKRVLREQGSSLLPVGITEVEGDFDAGEAVEVVCTTASASARES